MDFNRQIIEEFRAHRGRVGGMFEGARLVLLTTTGARTGRPHTVPVGFLPDPGRLLVIASAGGADRHPAWFHNLVAHPRVTVETGPFTLEADAVVLDGEERAQIWERAVESDPGWAEYQKKTARVIPVVALHPVRMSYADLPEGELLRAVHDAFRRDLRAIRDEVARGQGLGAQLRVNCLMFCGGMRHHHQNEDGDLFPYLRGRHPELAPVLDGLGEEHEVLAGLLDELQQAVASESDDLAALVDRLVTRIEAHLDGEEAQLVPVLNALRRPNRITNPDTFETVHKALVEMSAGPPPLPADADIAEPFALPVKGRWANASGRAARDAGVVLFAHGGGFEQSRPELDQLAAYHLSKASGRPAFAVDYSLAPGHPFPAAMDELVAAYRALLAQGVPAERTVLFGESSGATLVLEGLLALRAQGAPLPGAVVAVSPITDFTITSPSVDAPAGPDAVTRELLERILGQYLNGLPNDQAPQSPLHGDLSGLPRMLLAVGGNEALLDDSQRYADAAAKAGVDVTLDVYEGMPHAFQLTVLAEQRPAVATVYLERLSTWLTA
ncbi:nitroreductase/quinone reductase family protein [Actinomadura rupiterrae]|uniref:nitroreductase/quinone reductase family protein n=1 Tax=Actinomadura rupiterrae TaxID=559627 RepID=UPI0020A25D85|nr:nitroreductase/quinone reductase family protein [Actinomadura rupiterrae]MCP2342808.1 deazaflavin-dependent oxidoreductase (nitroreductase family) [Actinomadura rupiterrae]